MELKLRKIGNSMGIILPTELLAALHVREGDTIYADIPNGRTDTIELTAIDASRLEMLEAAEEIRREYRHGLKALAKR